MSPEEGNGTQEAHAFLAKISWALRSDAGEVRLSNEDFAGIYAPTSPDDSWDRPPLFVVADGLGGHAAGEVASRIAVETTLAEWADGSPGPPHQAMRAAIRAANAAVFDAGHDVGRHGMGTTLTAAAFAGREVVVGHVGDSRAYLVRGEQCLQLTSDHSRVAELLRRGLVTPEQARTHPARSMLTRSLGAAPAVQVDIVRHDIAQGDVLVLCSDGLWDMVSRSEVVRVSEEAVGGSSTTVVDAAERLVGLAVQRGAPDNVTAVVVTITSDRPIPPADVRRRPLFFRGRGA